MRWWPVYLGTFVVTSVLGISQLQDYREPETEKPVLVATTNTDYILEVARWDRKLYPLIENGKRGLADYISRRLAGLEHINPKEYYDYIVVMNTPTPDDLMVFKSKNLIKIYYLLQALSDDEFRERIGKELGLDTKDRMSEHGGVFHLQNDGKLEIEMLSDDSGSVDLILSEGIGFGRSSSDRSYIPAEPEYTLDILLPFHFHAHRENYPQSSAISNQDGRQTVFTPLGKGRFNVDIGLFDDVKIANGERVHVNIDLGTYDY